jgi:hypothetical protein
MKSSFSRRDALKRHLKSCVAHLPAQPNPDQPPQVPSNATLQPDAVERLVTLPPPEPSLPERPPTNETQNVPAVHTEDQYLPSPELQYPPSPELQYPTTPELQFLPGPELDAGTPFDGAFPANALGLSFDQQLYVPTGSYYTFPRELLSESPDQEASGSEIQGGISLRSL